MGRGWGSGLSACGARGAWGKGRVCVWWGEGFSFRKGLVVWRTYINDVWRVLAESQ